MRKCERCNQYKDYPHFADTSWTCKECVKTFAESVRREKVKAVINANRQFAAAQVKRGVFDGGGKS